MRPLFRPLALLLFSIEIPLIQFFYANSTSLFSASLSILIIDSYEYRTEKGEKIFLDYIKHIKAQVAGLSLREMRGWRSDI